MNLGSVKTAIFDQLRSMTTESWVRNTICQFAGGALLEQAVELTNRTIRVFCPKRVKHWIPKISEQHLKLGFGALGFASMFGLVKIEYTESRVAGLAVVCGALYGHMRWRGPPPKLPKNVYEVKAADPLKLTEAFAKFLEPLGPGKLEPWKKSGKVNAVFAQTGLSLEYLARSVAKQWPDRRVYYVEGDVDPQKWEKFLSEHPKALVMVDKKDRFNGLKVPKEMITCEVFADEERTYKDDQIIRLGVLTEKVAKEQLGQQNTPSYGRFTSTTQLQPLSQLDIPCFDLIQRIGMPECVSIDKHPESKEKDIIAKLSEKVPPMQLIPRMGLLGVDYVPPHAISVPRALKPATAKEHTGKNSQQWTMFSGMSLQQICNQEQQKNSKMFYWDINHDEAQLNHLLDFLYQRPEVTLIATYKQLSEQFLTFLSFVPRETRIFLHKPEPLYEDETLGALEGYFAYLGPRRQRPKPQPNVAPAPAGQPSSNTTGP